MNRKTSTLTAAILAVQLVGAAPAPDLGWTGFRGRAGSGVSGAPVDLSNLAPTVVWRVAIGSGYSGVVVDDGRAITMFHDEESWIVALDAATGEELWRRSAGPPYPGRDGSWTGPVSTPVIHGDLVVALEPWGRLFALRATDGGPVWSVHLARDLGAARPAYGFGSSPLVVGDTLVVHGGGAAGTVLGFDVATGEVRWTVGREAASNPSPVALTLGGREMVVASGEINVFGIDAATGEALWTYPHGGAGSRGQGSLVPVGAGGDRIFLAHDNDESQLLTVRREGDRFRAERAWLDRGIRNSYAPAVSRDGLLFGFSARVLVCVEVATGEVRWRSRAPGDGFLALAGEALVVLTKDGRLHVLRATPTGFEELAALAVFDGLTWTPPSVADGAIFARSLDEIVRVELRGGRRDEDGRGTVAAVGASLDPGDGPFGRFVRSVESAADPAELIDAFFESTPETPLIEDGGLVHFVYRGDDEEMAIAGDPFGARSEAAMVRVGGSDLFYFSIRLLPSARISYVFEGDHGPVLDPNNPRRTAAVIFGADRELSSTGRQFPMSELRMPRWERPRHLADPDPATRGRVEQMVVASRALGNVTLGVYLPFGYGDSDLRYPVVYVHGPTPPDLSALPRALDNLISRGDLRPVIAVFTESALSTGPEYTEFWSSELVPAVDARYSTIPTADGRVGVGGDLGALLALFLAFERPDMTSGLGMQSLAFVDSDVDALRPYLRTAGDRPLRIYLDWGTYSMYNELEGWDLRRDSRRYRRMLERLGYTVVGGEVPDGDGWASWRNRWDVMLQHLVPNE